MRGLIAQRDGRAFSIRNQHRVLLRRVANLCDGQVDLLDAGRLFARRGADLADQRADLVDARDDVAHRAACGLRDPVALFDGRRRFGAQRVDLLDRGRAALCKCAHFGRDHREALAVFARARGLDGRVQRQDVGLERDAFDRARDLGDPARRATDVVHRRDHALHRGVAVRRGGRRIRDQRIGLRRVLGTLLHGGGDLFHAGGRLFDAARLRRDSRGDVAAAGCNVDRAARDVGGAVAHLRDDPREAVADPVDRLHEPADLVVARMAARGRAVTDAHAEIARRIALGGPCRRIERPAHDAAYHDDEQRRERRDEHGADHQEAVAGGAHGGEQFVVERDAADEPLPLRNRRERHEFRGRAAIVRGRVGRRVREPPLAGREHLRIRRTRVVGRPAVGIRMHDEGAARRALRRIEHEVVAVVADLQRADAVLDELEFGADVEADEQRADHAAGRIGHRLVLRDVRPAEQLREARVAAPGDERCVRGPGTVEPGADGTRAVLLLQRRRDAHEIVAVAREDRRDRAAFLQELVGNRIIEVERLAAREQGRRGDAADVDGARRVEREIRREEAREQRHRAVGFGRQRLVEQVDHRADRLFLVDDPHVCFFSQLLAGEMSERPRENGKQYGDECARQRRKTRADAHPAQLGQSHGTS